MTNEAVEIYYKHAINISNLNINNLKDINEELRAIMETGSELNTASCEGENEAACLGPCIEECRDEPPCILVACKPATQLQATQQIPCGGNKARY